MTYALKLERPAKTKPALKLVRTQDLSRDEWLTVRRQGIGSSDAAAAVGLNPYKSQLQLWMEKTGRDGALPVVDPNDDQSPMYWGTLLEPIVAAHYTRRSGHRVRRVNAVLQHPEHSWMLANIDREVVGASDVQILECKTAGIHGARLWRDGVPEYVQLQVMHQLAVTGKQAADVAVLLGGQELQVFRIERDDTLIAQLVAWSSSSGAMWSETSSHRPMVRHPQNWRFAACIPGTAAPRWTSPPIWRCRGCFLIYWRCGRSSPPRLLWSPNSSSAFSSAWVRLHGRYSRSGKCPGSAARTAHRWTPRSCSRSIPTWHRPTQ